MLGVEELEEKSGDEDEVLGGLVAENSISWFVEAWIVKPGYARVHTLLSLCSEHP